jgi:hypothetical protein
MGLQAFGRVDEAFLQQLARFGMTDLRELWAPQHWEAHKRDTLMARHSLLDWFSRAG